MVKNKARFHLSCNYSCTLYFLMKMKEVTLKDHQTSACLNLKLQHNKTETKKVKVKNVGMEFIKTCDEYRFKLKFGHIFSYIFLPLTAGEKQIFKTLCLEEMFSKHFVWRKWVISSTWSGDNKTMGGVLLGDISKHLIF